MNNIVQVAQDKEEILKKEELTKLVIMGCHPGKSYEEALEEENSFIGFPITLSRVLEALGSRLDFFEDANSIIDIWEFTVNGRTATIDDQSEKVISNVLWIIKGSTTERSLSNAQQKK